MMNIKKLPLKYPIDVGAPIPKVLASEHFLLLFYFIGKDKNRMTKSLIERDVVSDRGVVIIEFENYLNFKFGTPNDEVLQGHPYFNLGLRPYSFFEVYNSDWINQLININRVHPRYDECLFEDYRHFILTFPDSTFECVADSYKVSFSTKSMGELISEKARNLILSH